jgi:hypothetical protein
MHKEGGGEKTVLCATVNLSLFVPNVKPEIHTVHAAATKNLKERTPADLELIDEEGATQVYWVLPVQEKHHLDFPKLFPQGPFHKAHAKMVAAAYKSLCT